MSDAVLIPLPSLHSVPANHQNKAYSDMSRNHTLPVPDNVAIWLHQIRFQHYSDLQSAVCLQVLVVHMETILPSAALISQNTGHPHSAYDLHLPTSYPSECTRGHHVVPHLPHRYNEYRWYRQVQSLFLCSYVPAAGLPIPAHQFHDSVILKSNYFFQKAPDVLTQFLLLRRTYHAAKNAALLRQDMR